MRWISKNKEKKEYKQSLGETDYNIPTFSYKSSFFICFLTFIIVLFVPQTFDIIFKSKLPGIIISSILSGFVISYAQHFIQSNKKMSKSFWVIFVLFTIFSFVMLFLFTYGQTLL